MNVVKIEVVGSKFVETVIVKGLTPLMARAKAKALNDLRDSGSEDSDETGLVSYVVKA